MKGIAGFIVFAIMLFGLIVAGCDGKEKLLQERLDRTTNELEGVRVSLEKTGQIADKVPDLEAKIKQSQEETGKLKASIDGLQQDKDKALKEKEDAVQKSKHLKDDNAKLNEVIKSLKEESVDLKRRIRELESALNDSGK